MGYTDHMDDLDRPKFGPPDDTAILPWYGGIYSHGFIALHPFFAVDGLHPRSCEHGSLNLERSQAPHDLDLLEWMDEEAAQRSLGKEISGGSLDDIAVRFGRPVKWREVWPDIDLHDHCELDQALRTHIHGLRADLENKDAARHLVDYCDRQGLFLPTEGCFQPVMQSNLVDLFVRAGLTEVIAGDEFGEDERTVTFDLLREDSAWMDPEKLPAYGVRRFIAPDRSLLVWVHWDSFYTAIFGTAQRLQGVRLDDLFEGFWCSEETTTYWLTQPAITLTQ